ncbi:hypothetical protein Acsp02_24180 [Actinoplanes sp. NBRC 103695]|nr:hypothetical protein Acsp02_24180 [Actinoplanes sp. NBRC 103695]
MAFIEIRAVAGRRRRKPGGSPGEDLDRLKGTDWTPADTGRWVAATRPTAGGRRACSGLLPPS